MISCASLRCEWLKHTITVPQRSSPPEKLTEQLMGIKRRVLYFMPIYMPLSVSFEPMFEKRRYGIASTFNARY
jgi:hypothetical protein